MEDFKDGYEPPVFSNGSKLNENRKFFAKSRIYVKTLDDVAPVDTYLRSKNYQTFSMLSSIENLKAISSVLNDLVSGSTKSILGLFSKSLKKLSSSLYPVFSFNSKFTGDDFRLFSSEEMIP